MNDLKRNSIYDRKRNNVHKSSEIKIEVPDFTSSELLGEEAAKLAKEISKNGLTKSQIRNFYGEVKRIESLLKSSNENWSVLYNRIKLIKAKAVYNKYRDKKTENSFGPFANFLCKSIDKIHNDEKGKENFMVFCQLFEAVVGYASEHVKNR
ncbi:MAG: type III-A CRISPR-associated protein Csm2 [Fibrobacter sp.]|nr:type III-A CRISPR-associated protein Csm2 [Fibrobacter sp.]